MKLFPHCNVSIVAMSKKTEAVMTLAIRKGKSVNFLANPLKKRPKHTKPCEKFSSSKKCFILIHLSSSEVLFSYPKRRKLLNIFVHCRPGFEREAAEEVELKLGQLNLNLNQTSGEVIAKGKTAFASVPCPASEFDLKLSDLIFSRQLLFCADPVSLPEKDRATPILEQLQSIPDFLIPDKLYSDVVIEPTDSSSGGELQRFCKKIARPIENGLKKLGYKKVYSRKDLPRINIVFPDYSQAFVGIAQHGNSSPNYMGIPRLKFPALAPSRSTLKLEEAFLTFLTEDERKRFLTSGMTAVDLGASPGGWTYQFVDRKIRVTAIDNGSMADSLMETGLVKHLREDAFRYTPKNPVDWLVCDMIEKPSRVAALVGQWFEKKNCRNAIINLKLPMKKRYSEVQECLQLIAKKGKLPRENITCKQLYHDREEVTLLIRGK